MNLVILIGRLTKDPELRYTANNRTPVAKFTLAVNRIFKRQGEPDTDFIPIIVFGKPAENCGKYLAKGSLVAVAGRIQTRSWEQEGKKHFATEVMANEVHFLGKGQAKEGSQDFHEASEEESDDLPF